MVITFIKSWDPSIYRKLIENDLTSTLSILLLSTLELQEVLNLSTKEVIDLKYQLSSSTKSQFQIGTVKTLRLSTGCNQIDNIIRGGFPISNILEVCGAASTGKTQFCLQLLLMVQLPIEIGGFNKAGVYISTVKHFPSKRFRQLSLETPKKLNLQENISFEDNVYITHCKGLEELFLCLNETLPKLMENIPIGLIIVDSIAGLFRGNKEETNYKERSLHFSRITTQLRILAKVHSAVIMFTNEMIINLQTGEMEAALSLAWHNLVVQRFKISKKTSSAFPTHREFRIINSYELPIATADFSIHFDGIT